MARSRPAATSLSDESARDPANAKGTTATGSANSMGTNANWVATVNPNGVSNNTRLFDNVPRLLGRYTVATDPITPIVRAQHGDASGVRGAAWLWPAS